MLWRCPHLERRALGNALPQGPGLLAVPETPDEPVALLVALVEVADRYLALNMVCQ